MLDRSALVLVLSLLAGCSRAELATLHQPYAPLLDRGGQLDVSARAGVGGQGGASAGGQVAFAPTDNLEIAGAVDFVGHEGSIRHLGGGLALGTFSRADVLRMELMAGVHAGYGEGYYHHQIGTCGWGGPCEIHDWELRGSYVEPFVQGLVGFEVPYFELAGGLRVAYQAAAVHAHGNPVPAGTEDYSDLWIDPVLVVRFPFRVGPSETMRIELMGGTRIAAGTPGSQLYDLRHTDNLQPYALLGLGLQVDALPSLQRRAVER